MDSNLDLAEKRMPELVKQPIFAKQPKYVWAEGHPNLALTFH